MKENFHMMPSSSPFKSSGLNNVYKSRTPNFKSNQFLRSSKYDQKPSPRLTTASDFSGSDSDIGYTSNKRRMRSHRSKDRSLMSKERTHIKIMAKVAIVP